MSEKFERASERERERERLSINQSSTRMLADAQKIVRG